MNALFSSLLLTTALVVGQHASATTCPTDSTEVRNKRKMESKGNWSGLSFSALSMAQFQGNLENYTATWGARENLGLITDDAFDSFRVSINPFERRQKLLGEFLGITTGIGFDWIRLGVAPDRVLGFDASSETIVATALEANSVATAFMLQPLVWALLTAWQMCQAKPSAMVWPPAAVALLGTLLWCLA